MKLLDLLSTVNATVWISTSWGSEDECIYFGEAGKAPIELTKSYVVTSVFPEKYPARFCTGITIIVTRHKDFI